ncbi:hypothetical protein [Allostreptomyces psammosilenae]|uniref:Lipoprotein n=1 Tax=Allostreptomyces psammosilenae TaxID=1892865 RepID=A0A853A222_9ACTN|nr:hypothetical protein [Allostreptomyces psammosilenae]NYI08439.1 hypothetical protein [Allostreptomyces psammosilenae]
MLAALGAVATGCTSSEDDGAPEPHPDELVLRRSAEATAALIAHRDATVAAHPELAASLRPLGDDLAAHLTAFGEGAGLPSAASPPAQPSTSTSATATATATAGGDTPGGAASPAAGPSVPDTPDEALRALADLCRRTADARMADLLAASALPSRLIASVAACETGHAHLLTP